MCESMHALRQRAQEREAASRRRQEVDIGAGVAVRGRIDPDLVWLAPHRTIVEFLRAVPQERQLRLRGEELLADPDAHLGRIAEWLGIDRDPAALDRMKHPEDSPFACFGPPNARFGDDPGFLEKPWLRPYANKAMELDGPLTWDPHLSLSPEVKELALRFGY